MDNRWKKRVIEELREGQDYTLQLKHLLQNGSGEKQGYSVSAQKLACKIMTSFSETLSVLSSRHSPEVSWSQVDSQSGDSVCSGGDRRAEKSGESKKSVSNDMRGSYKRKRSAAQTVVSSTMEDGFRWRKYGQKDILNSEYPRSYYRCSRKYDRGCKATKQVQQMEQDPKKYQTVYIGTHTCIGTTEEATTPEQSREVSSDSTKEIGKANMNAINKQEYAGGGEVDEDNMIWKELMLLETGPDVMDVSGLSSCMDSDSHGLEFSFDFNTTKFHFN